VSDASGVRRPEGHRGPRVIRLPSPRRLLRPEPVLLVAGLALVGAMNAPVGVGAERAPSAAAASTTQVALAPGADSLRWFDEAQQRERPNQLRQPYAVSLPSAVAATTGLVGPPMPAGAFAVPDALWAAYTAAVAATPASCNLDPRLLAAIGQVESGSLAGRSLDNRHRAVPAVYGPVLDGRQYARIPDTDAGRWDGNRTWDRAVGPMQFIPSTWSRHGRDADGDGVADPQDIEDAALSAAGYLCAGGRDLSRPADLRAAILSYNHSERYLAAVLGLLPGVVPGGAVLPASAAPVLTSPLTGRTPPATTSSRPAPSSSSSGTTAPTTSSTTSSPTTSSTTTSRTTTTAPSSTSAPSTTTSAPSTTTTSPTSTTTSPTATTTAPPSSTTTTTPSPTTSTPEECPTASPTDTATPTGTTSATSPATTAPTATTTATSTATPTGSCTTQPTSSATGSQTASPTPSPSTSSANAAEKALDDQAPTAD